MKKGVGGAVLTGSSLSRFRVRFAEGKSAQITQTDSTPRQTAKAAEHKPVKQNTARKKETICVVIDAGHGGADPGAVGRKKTYEKHVVLEIAKKECAPFLPVRPTSLSPYINARSARSPKKRIFL